MVFLRDEGGVFEASLEAVWQFVGSGDHHSGAHQHRNFARRRHSENVGEYTWEQTFQGTAGVRFTMRWTTFYPLGIAYEVLEGPFVGSRFFIFYEPLGDRTGVSMVGDFHSPTLSDADLPRAVEQFFATEFEQDHGAMRAVGPKPKGSNPPRG
ncbi:MAG: hypothetical protein QXG65_04540 [Thermoplasmata archaeon]